MMYLHTSFDLSEGTSLTQYREALAEFTAAMQARNLLVDTGPILERCRHPVMDTDADRAHRYFFVITFSGLEQCNAAVKHIQAADPSTDPAHRAIYGNIIGPIFSCWADPTPI